MNQDRLIEYHEQQLINHYHVEKERQKTNRFIALLIAITLISLFFIYGFFIVPVVEETMTADHGGKIVESSNIGGDNINGLQN